MKSMKKLMMLLLSLCLVLSMSIPTFAAESGDDKNVISNARDGILQVNTYYKSKDKTKGLRPLKGGTAFLVNEKMVVTCWHVLHLSDRKDDRQFRKQLEEEMGEPFLTNPDALTGTFQYQIVVKRDVVIGATILQESQEMDFAILELDSQIYDRKALPLDTEATAKETDDVFALGFSAAPIENMDVQYYTSKDAVVTDGIVSMIGDVGTVPRIQHSAKISAGNSGGPLLNANGEVIGVNALGVNGDYFYATQIGEVISIMDSMGYQYTAAGETAEPVTESEAIQTIATGAETEPETEPVPDKSVLQSLVDDAKKMELENYTEESVEVFTQALTNAEDVLSDSGATPEAIDAAEDELKNANLALEEKKDGPNMMLFLIIGAVVIVVVIIIIVLVVVSGSKKKKAAPPTRGSVPMGGGSVPPAGHPSKPAGFTPPPVSTPSSAPSGSYGGGGETSVLDAGAGETTVLSSGPVSNGYLIRKKTGEKIMLKKSVFVIGKERSKVDYCISDNTSISRVHAKLLAKGDGCYIEDQNSTNFTFVNGTKLDPQKEAKLKDRDTVKLSDELFEYHKG